MTEYHKRESAWHIGGYDGCLCTCLSVMNFEIDVSCRKSSASASGETVVRVSCPSIGVDIADLRLVAEEVQRQVLEAEPQANVVLKLVEEDR